MAAATATAITSVFQERGRARMTPQLFIFFLRRLPLDPLSKTSQNSVKWLHCIKGAWKYSLLRRVIYCPQQFKYYVIRKLKGFE